MESSQVSKDQNFIGDEFVRSATYTEPRTVTLNTKYQGVPVIEAWTGYAVMVVSKSGKRRVEIGPKAVQLEYDESLEVLQLSTGKPKTTDKLFETAYLRVENNHITDILTVETEDHVTAELKLSYRVNFTGDSEKWFSVENYVKFLCDHERSVLRGAVRKYKIEAFYANSTEILRDIILGTAKSEGGKRLGATFEENGMHIVDVEVLKVTISDEAVRKKLDESQIAVVQSNIELATAKRNLEVFKQKELIAREESETKTATAKQKNDLAIAEAESGLKVILARLENTREETENQIEVEKLNQEKLKLVSDSGLERARKQEEYKLEMTTLNQKIALEGLKAEVEAVVAKFQAVAPRFTEALLALSNNEVMAKVAQAWNIQSIVGGTSISDALAKVFRGSPLEAKLQELLPKLPPKNGEPEKRA
jgi:major vault protein